ncbi:MAG: hypothetical protein JO202_17725 [Ktedonobacteraceae bacterium]|nr:hypothetical protein [Ktedonobacteraceae bacterium]
MHDTSSAEERFSSLSLHTRASIYSIIAAAMLILLMALGSRGFHWFDTALLGYTVATVFAVAAATYKYTLWLAYPPTRRYWWRSWQLLLSYESLRRYKLLIAKAITGLFTQPLIRKRGLYRWVIHQCIFWGVLLSCALTFPLTFGWMYFTQTSGLYQLWVFGFPLLIFPVNTLFAFLIFHALDFSALLLLVGLVLAFQRRFHDLALIAVQRFRFDIIPLALLMSIVVSGLALTADSMWLGGAYYWYISLTHQGVVALWLISLPFGKFFHIMERPATVGIALYKRAGRDTQMQRCARCQEEFASVRFIQDLKKTLYDVGQNYTLPTALALLENGHSHAAFPREQATSALWWQDMCPACKRIMRAQANLSALGRGGNQFL